VIIHGSVIVVGELSELVEQVDDVLVLLCVLENLVVLGS
jgi:hypothetical protein